MSFPVVVVDSGGWPITESDIGVPMEVAENGFGIAVTLVDSGGFPVALVGGSPRISLTPGVPTVAENAAVDTVLAVLSISAASGNWLDPITYTLTDDAGGLFEIDNDDEIKTGGAFDYETATSHTITVEANNGTDDSIERTFTIIVTNVLEVTLNALTLDDSSIPEVATIDTVVGALVSTTGGSTLELFDDDGGKYALDGLNVVVNGVLSNGTDSITVREIHTDGSNSPRDTVLNITVTSAVDGYVFTYLILGF